MDWGRFAHIRRKVGGVDVSNLFDPPGKPFGWAHNEERRLIRDHLLRRGRYAGAALHFRIAAIQQRLHRRDLRFGQLQSLWRAGQPAAAARPPAFTRDELQHLVDLFADANHPTSLAIAAKAADMIGAV